MVKPNYLENLTDFSLCKDVFEKFGERRLIGRGEYFACSGEVMEYAGWIASYLNISRRQLQRIRVRL